MPCRYQYGIPFIAVTRIVFGPISRAMSGAAPDKACALSAMNTMSCGPASPASPVTNGLTVTVPSGAFSVTPFFFIAASCAAARDQAHLGARLMQPHAEIRPDRARAIDRDFHGASLGKPTVFAYVLLDVLLPEFSTSAPLSGNVRFDVLWTNPSGRPPAYDQGSQ